MKFWRRNSMEKEKEAEASVVPNGAALAGDQPPVPPEQPSTPQSTNVSVGGSTGEVGASKPAAVESVADSDEGVEVVRAATPQLVVTKPPAQQDPLPSEGASGAPAEKDYARNMSALSISTGESLTGHSNEDTGNFSFEEEELPDTPKSSLVSKKLPEPFANGDAGGGAARVPVMPSKAVDRIPELNELNQKTRGDGASGVTSQSVKMGDDVTETSFTTMTTAGDMGLERKTPPLAVDSSVTATPATAAGADRSRPRAVKPARVRARPALRSPRPPRHMRAVDWCPPPSATSSVNVASANRVSAAVGSVGGSGSAMASDKTAVTSRAVRLGDDATVTTFATMTTLGDAGSILEADTEDEASSGSETEEGAEEMEAEVRTEEGSMEDVADEHGVVDKIPSQSHKMRTGSLSGTTNHSVKAADDQSMVTFATTATFGGVQPQSADVMVDQVPTISSVGDNASMVTEDTVQMGDNRSLATWATANTMGGQLTGNVVDHVPEEDGSAEGGGSGGEGDAASPSDNTVGTSNAVKEDPSVTTFTTSVTAADSGINEVVDAIPTFAGGGGGTGRSVMSGVTSQAIRGSAVGAMVPDDRSVTSFATMTTMGDLPDIYETEVLPDEDYTRPVSADDLGNRPRVFSGNSFGEIDRNVVDVIPEAASSVASGTTNHSVRTGDDTGSVTTFGTMSTAGRELGARAAMEENDDENEGVVDKVPTLGSGASVVSGTTNLAVRLNDDQSVATWATAATSGVTGHVNEHVVDKTPEGGYASTASEATDRAIKDPEDPSVATWNTVTTAGVSRARSPAPAPEPYAVDRVPSFHQGRPGAPSLSGTTNHTVKAADDQSVVTFATMTTAGGLDRPAAQDHVVDRVPSIPPKTDTSIVTADTVQMGDNRSLATWATSNTMGGAITGNVVDHVPSADEDEENRTVGTSNAVKDDPSVTTFTTSAASSRGINEVVDAIPTFAGGGSGTGRSVVSGATNRAVRMGDDRSMASFATMTTAGDMGGAAGDYEANSNPGGYSNEDHLVNRLPSSAGSAVSGRTDAAVRLGDDLTVGTFATMTTAGPEGGVGSDQSGEENDASSSRPTAGILREGRLSRPSSALRSGRDYRASATDSSSAPAMNMGAKDLPINAGESVSNTHILRAISDLRFHVDYRMGELRELNRRDSERVAQIVQQEQAKRTALEARLHAQLVMQSESMVAMELKLLRLEAKAAQRDSRRQQRVRQPGGLAGSGTAPSANITDRLPPIAATPSTPNRSDEEEDSFEEMELTPRGANRRELGSGLYSQLGGGSMHRGGPANIAVVTRSGASVASAVTATSFQEGAMNDDERSGDGDIEDEGDDNGDGSASTPTHGSRHRRLRSDGAEISNLESILLNPIASGNDQGISTRAVRGDTDGMSSLPTSVTSATVASTIVTATTRGNESVGITRISSRASEEEALPGVLENQRGRFNSDEYDVSAEGDRAGRRPRSRSHSPLTVQSASMQSAEPSLGTSILSTAAVAPSRSFGSRRANAAAALANAQEGNRSMANRVVSFTASGLTDSQSGVGLPPQMENEGGDSITMPDELDNVSDIADAFSNSARVWREEYEARLDAIHKRLGG